MNMSLNRYTTDMLVTLSSQSLPSLAVNALVRGAVFVLIIQLISYASMGQFGTLASTLLLMGVFSFALFSIDLIEKYWARERLRRRG